MATVASVDVAFTASSVDLRRGLDGAARSTRNFTNMASRNYRNLRNDIVGLRGAFLGFIGILGAGQLLRSVDELSTLADQSSLSIERFSQLNAAFAQQGLSTQQFSQSLRDLNNRLNQFGLGTGEAAGAFRTLNLTFQELANLSVEDRLFRVIRALEVVPDAAQRAFLASRIFGEEVGPRLARAIETGSDALLAFANQERPIQSSDITTIRDFNDALSRLQSALIALGTSLSPILNLLLPLINGIAALARESQILVVVFGTALVAALAGPFIRSINTSRLAFVSLRDAIFNSNVQQNLFLVNNDRTAGRLQRWTNGLLLYATQNYNAAGATGLFARASLAGGLALRTFGAALRFALGPLGLILIAVEAVISIFQFGFVNTLRRAGNLVLSLVNGIISLTNAFLRFIGIVDGDAIPTFELWELQIEDTVDSMNDLDTALVVTNTNVVDFAQSVSDLLDRLDPTRVSTRRFEEGVTLLDNALANGTITIAEYQEAIRLLNEELAGTAPAIEEVEEELSSFESAIQNAMDITDELSDLGVQAFNGLSDALTDFITTGMADFASFARSIIRDLIRIQIQRALAFAIGGGGGSIFGAFLGRQNGGPVNAGQPYIVGEAGPELFVPRSGGTIVPNNELGGGGTVNNITINAVDTQSFQAALARDPEFVSGLVERGNRTRGIRR